MAAQELSATLTDVDNLTFDGLLTSFATLGQRMAEAILQALIFKAIMASIGMAGGAARCRPAALSGAQHPRAMRGRIFGGGRLMTAQHGAVFSRGRMALMTGAVSGAALLEGAGDEAAVPLVRSARTGNLSVETSGQRRSPGRHVQPESRRGSTPAR